MEVIMTTRKVSGKITEATPELVELLNIHKTTGQTLTTLSKQFNIDRKLVFRANEIGLIKLSNGKVFINNDAFQETINCYKLFKQNKTLMEIRELTGIKGEVFKSRMNQILGYELDTSGITVQYNRSIFRNIDSPDKAYWLGFILADGSIHRGTLKIKLQECDHGHLVKFCEFIGVDPSKIGSERHTTTNNILYSIQLSSVELCADLNTHGICKQKSLIETIPDCFKTNSQFVDSFIRGIFDGDGSINSSNLSFVGSKEVMQFTADKSVELCGLCTVPKVYEKQKTTNNMFLYSWCIYNKPDKIKFLTWLYHNSTTYLDRKYRLASDFCRWD